ncbi:MAG: sulfatase [Planctomycetota bacterium]|nr:MAG: sulfatase [Planctomycetota bacterium]
MRHWFSRLCGVRAPSDSKPTTTSRRNNRTWSSDALHLLVLSSFAIAQPVYDRLGHQHAFLADQNVTPATMGLLVFLMSFVMPACIVIVELLMARWKRGLQDVPHAIAVFVFLVLLALPFCVRMSFLQGIGVLLTALATGGIGLWSYFEFPPCRMVVTWASPGILIFPGVLLSQYATAMATVGSSSIRSERWNPAPVVMVVFDEFCGMTLMTTEREIDADRFPNFAALAKQSTWFRNAASVNPLTQFAVPAILSGKYPTTEFSPGPVELPQNIFSTLTSAGGYEIAAFEPVTNLAPRSLAETGHRPVGAWRQSLLLANILSRVYLFQISPPDYRVHLPKIPQAWFGWNDSRLIDRSRTRGRFSYAWMTRRVPYSTSVTFCCRTCRGAIFPPGITTPRTASNWGSCASKRMVPEQMSPNATNLSSSSLNNDTCCNSCMWIT